MAKAIKKREAFTLHEPEAACVQLVGDFSEWAKNPINLKKQKDGVWKATVSLPSGTHQYRFLVDGQWRDDPNCPTRVPNPFGEMNCIREVGS
ncbi:MAG: isoamylase early set domain-containing protein [Verrucomicrobia bacterium]|nr:isoamylase early set domain-containing protein [Verrucomicrobiota bacterium]